MVLNNQYNANAERTKMFARFSFVCAIVFCNFKVYCHNNNATLPQESRLEEIFNSQYAQRYRRHAQGPASFPQLPPPPPVVTVSNQEVTLGFVCVPIGTCNSIAQGNLTLCPSGQVPCTTGLAGGNQCGIRYVSPVNTSDGFSTPGAYPWLVYIVNQTGYAGAGVLLNQYNVLTAAHKVYMNSGFPELIAIHMGVYESSNLGQRYNVSRVFLHPNFNPSNLFNDLALLRLSSPVIPVSQGLINSACLPTEGQSFVGQTCWVSGWGKTDFYVNDMPTLQQRQVQVPIVSYSTCYTSMSSPELLGANANTYLDAVGELCAGGEAQKDACTHDGGSPLVCNVNGRFAVAGLVIWGKGCGRPGVYGVYVNVATYVSWIQSSMELMVRL